MRTSLSTGGTSSLIAGAVQRFYRWRSDRHAIQTLSQYSDAALTDMGLTRDTIGDAVRHGRR